MRVTITCEVDETWGAEDCWSDAKKRGDDPFLALVELFTEDWLALVDSGTIHVVRGREKSKPIVILPSGDIQYKES